MSVSMMVTVDGILKKVQAGSGLAFSTFLIAHLSGHALACLDFSLAESALVTIRKIAQDPTIEVAVVFGSVIIHISASVGRVLIRNLKKKRRKSKESSVDKVEPISGEDQTAGAKAAGFTVSKTVQELKLHRLAGYLLSGLYLWHVADTRIKSIMAFSDSNVLDLTYITWSLQQSPLTSTFAYLLLGSTAVYHGVYGTASALKTFGIQVSLPLSSPTKTSLPTEIDGETTLAAVPKTWLQVASGSNYVRVGIVGVAMTGLTLASIAASRYGGLRGILKLFYGDDGGVSSPPWPRVPKEKLWREMNEVFGGLIISEV
ncbi:hypothetical protein BC829DRAFT_381281 [Chytridium lagenaria]|nr:hypothetical protein BC829DRAFT_381281 [Chytridium lagenaria]